MKAPGVSAFLVAMLLGVVTGDLVVQKDPQPAIQTEDEVALQQVDAPEAVLSVQMKKR
ncbi:hypothetical protein [Tumebacillus lipolyticus]|uniref:Uncharacterized protein n=1 Tax=Tumebacillus lipolyticus TaxID=1280370 RepID=A0ABW5A1Z1_9BACL